MTYISSDTNVWLDFDVISRIELPFRLPCTYLMFTEALREEIMYPLTLLQKLQGLGLKGVDLTADELFYADEIADKYVKLSGYDRTALAIAKYRGIPLLTGDNALRKAAKNEGVDVFGTIGLLDMLFELKLINKSEYKYCIESFLNHGERRLPVEELQKRLGLL